MMAYEKTAYEPHPVSPERKAELNGLGFRVVDARFAPEGVLPTEVAKARGTDLTRRRRSQKPKGG